MPNIIVANNLKGRVLLQTGDEEHAGHAPAAEHRNLANGNIVKRSEMVVDSRTEELVLEAELVLAGTQSLLLAKPRQRGKEQIFEKRRV